MAIGGHAGHDDSAEPKSHGQEDREPVHHLPAADHEVGYRGRVFLASEGELRADLECGER